MGKRTSPFTYNTEFILRSIDLGVYGVTHDGEIEFCNDEFTIILGYSKEEVVGRNAHHLFHNRGADGEAHVQTECGLCNGNRMNVTRRISREVFWTKQGVPITVECIISVVRSAANAGLIISFRTMNPQSQTDMLLQQNRLLEMIAKGDSVCKVMHELSVIVDKVLPGTVNSVFLYDAVRDVWQHYDDTAMPSEFAVALDRLQSGSHIGYSDTMAVDHKPVIVRDILPESVWKEDRMLPPSHNYTGWITCPIHACDQKLLGTFALYYQDVQGPADHELKMIEMFAHLAGLVLEREYREKRIQELAFYDGITGLANRALYWETATMSLAETHEVEDFQFALLFFDVDRFRVINEKLGHEMGDLLLKEIALRLQATCGQKRFAARLGGDEFVVIIKEAILEDGIANLAESVLEVMTAPFIIGSGQVIHVTISMGVALFPQNGKDAYTLTKNAEAAMYDAKGGGRNALRFYAPSMESKIHERMWIEEELDYALDDQQFSVYYQPKMHIDTNQITSAEALLRWFHPSRGLIAPAEFISIAEETGQIIAIGEWVLRKVCQQLQDWKCSGQPMLRIAVNVSPRQFQHPQFVHKLRQIFEETDTDPAYIEVEITETSLMDNTDETMNKLIQLKQIGVRIAIDDFGMGYSSLGYLKRFPVDALKIDQSFIREVPEDSTSAIVMVMIGLGHRLQMRVIAEGVETEAQLNFLRDHECDEIQGYFLSRPMPAREFESFLQAVQSF